MKEFVAFRRTFEQFRAVGFRLAMDDVGPGYSGLLSITGIAPDFIKAGMRSSADGKQARSSAR